MPEPALKTAPASITAVLSGIWRYPAETGHGTAHIMQIGLTLEKQTDQAIAPQRSLEPGCFRQQRCYTGTSVGQKYVPWMCLLYFLALEVKYEGRIKPKNRNEGFSGQHLQQHITQRI